MGLTILNNVSVSEYEYLLTASGTGSQGYTTKELAALLGGTTGDDYIALLSEGGGIDYSALLSQYSDIDISDLDLAL